ncbi:DNA cytosine methyltransferase [Bacteroides neonati]|uniref:DNA cytosine methyltransferase n=1 Tax=Bacteroides neonati TaxID=1347393 RepID=UPI0004B9C861|nr:DNA cytosine methyltransferase [Bacteroides neonati]
MNIFSFFAGAGFLDLGFELQGGYNIVFVNEFHEAFNRIYRYARQNIGLQEPRYGHHIEDITEYIDGEHEDRLQRLINWVEESKEEELTGFIGGPPCPDFSVAGKNKGRDGENGRLSGTYAQLICTALPDFFLFENVKGLYRTARHRQFFEDLKQRFREHGYSLTEQLVNSLEFGAAQDRDRIILIGFHQDAVDRLHLQTDGGVLTNFPWEAHKRYNLKEIKSLPWPNKSPYQENTPIPMPNGIIAELTTQHWWTENDVTHHPNANMYFQPRAGIVRFRTKEEGDVEKKCYKRLHRWRYSPTAAYGNNEVHIHPFLPRRISVAESLAIQSLPANFILPKDISLTDAFKTVGNGVPFVLANGIANSINDYVNHINN